MVNRTILFAEHEYYHVYNRGVDKRVLFCDAADHHNFLQRMYILNDVNPVSIRDLKKNKKDIYAQERHEPLVSIGAYCLMSNHFHILLTPCVEGGVSTFMRKLGTSYSMYFNSKHKRTGTLFEGKFKAKHVDTDEYLKYLYAYIHLNPAKLAPEPTALQTSESTLAFLQQYPYSSFIDYLGYSRKESALLASAAFPEYFHTAAEHIAELHSWLTFDPQL